MNGVISKCCEDGRRTISLSFMEHLYGHGTASAYLKHVTSTPPKWVMTVRHNEHEREFMGERTCEVRFCPFCGKSMPAVRLRNRRPMTVMVIADGGHYCDTCERRLDACRCPMPERLWEPAP